MKKTKKFITVVSVLSCLSWTTLVFGGDIHVAAEKGNLEEVKSLLVSDTSLINARFSNNNATPLIFATANNKPEVAKFLLKKGADVNARASNGHTALHYAAAYGPVDLVKLLLQKGAPVNFDVKDNAQGDDPGCTPLLYAAANGHLEIVKILLKKGASVNAKASYNTIHVSATPLIAATKIASDYTKLGGGPLPGTRADTTKKHGYPEVVKTLLTKGASIDLKDNFGRTALYYAAINGQAEVVQLLLERGATVDAKENRGITPLLMATQNQDMEVINLLLDKGADPNASMKGDKPWTPITLAEANDFKEILELLRNVVKQK